MALAMPPVYDGVVVEPVAAATLLLVRDGPDGLQVLMVVRHRQIDFAPGALVFPGGKLDPVDYEMANSDLNLASRIAAVRETFEECGILLGVRRSGSAFVLPPNVAALSDILADSDVGLDVCALTPYAHWVTPAILPKRFDTRFYIAAAPREQIARHDGREAVDTVWIEPGKALAEAAEGKRTLVLATRLNLELLNKSSTAEKAINAAANRPLIRIEPHSTRTETGHRLTIPVEAGYGGPDFDV